MSRRARRFASRSVGRSIHDEIQRAHLERAKRLLRESDLPLPKVPSGGLHHAQLPGSGFPAASGTDPGTLSASGARQNLMGFDEQDR